MQSNIFFRISILLIIASSMVACEGETNQEHLIRNNTNEAIQVQSTYRIDNSSIDQELAAGETLKIGSASDLGGREDVNPTDNITSLIIINQNNDTLKKGFTDENNWLIEVEQTCISCFSHNFVFPVNENDF